MSDQNFRLPEVKFRMDIAAPGGTKTKLLELYNRKLGSLMKAVYSSTLNSFDYEDLPRIRAIIRGGLRKCENVETVVFEQVSESKAQLLMNAGPIYNACPIPMQAYILLSLGVRSQHFGNKDGQATPH
jgi:hypothetical protein